MENEKPAPPLTPTDWARRNLQGRLDPLVTFLVQGGLHPDAMTLMGLAGNVVGAVFLALGYMPVGGLLILVSGLADALDGAMARKRGAANKFGAFLDSVTDRWSEMLILFGLLFYYLQSNDPLFWVYSLLVFAASMGSVMVSYTKARAEALGFDCNVGVLTRMERYLVMGPALVFNVPWLALWIIALLANYTALQRILHVRRQAYARKDAG